MVSLHELEDDQGILCTQRSQIQTIIKKYYQQLYSIQSQPLLDFQDYFSKIGLPKLSVEQNNLFKAPLTMMEIRQTIHNQKEDKASGPEGLRAQYYKQYEHVLQPILKELITNILEDGEMPDSWRTSTTLIPKEGKDLFKIQNYGPISLLKVDYKIYATN